MNYESDGFLSRKHSKKKKHSESSRSGLEQSVTAVQAVDSIVLRCDGRSARVSLPDGSIASCTLTDERPVAGDRVLVSAQGRIVRVLESEGNLYRESTTGSRRIAAGVQHLLLFLPLEERRSTPVFIEAMQRQVQQLREQGMQMDLTLVVDSEAHEIDPSIPAIFRSSIVRSYEQREQILDRLRGRRTALIGPSGSGKTTFLRWLQAEDESRQNDSRPSLATHDRNPHENPVGGPERAHAKPPIQRTSAIELFLFQGLQIIDMPGSDRPPLLFEEQSSEARAKAAQTKYVADESDYTFRCRHCGQLIGTAGAGTKNRNHCPHCLHSLHVDNEPGDRASLCRSVMEPISVWVRRDGEWALLHRCKSCGTIHSNRIAADDNETMLLSLAVRPLANPAFSLERLGAEAT